MSMRIIRWSVATVLALCVVTPLARAEPKFEPDFHNKIVEVFKDCQKLKPGMTRAELVKLEMFDQDWGPLGDPADVKKFQPHTTFVYRHCSLIRVDVDFKESDAKQAQPSDVVSKASMPYIDARPRR